MLRSLLAAAFLLAPVFLKADETPTAAFERQLGDATGSADVTVVHLWAPWCSNCRIGARPTAGWSAVHRREPGRATSFSSPFGTPTDGREVLEKNGVGAEKNFQLLLHPNGSRKRGEKMTELLGLPISWIPTTWVYKDGRLRYALNYGELHFPMLKQLIPDSTDAW